MIEMLYILLRLLQVGTFVVALVCVGLLVAYFSVHEVRATWKGDNT